MANPEKIPFVKLSEVPNAKLRRQEKILTIQKYRGESNDQLRHLILNEDRIDLLIELVGFDYHVFHEALIEFQKDHPFTIQLGPRGWGKTLVATILKDAHEVIKNRNIRILLTSETATQAKNMLSAIKAVLTHDRVTEIFGDLKGDTWNETEINIAGRTITAKEKTISIAGADGAVTSGHYDLIEADDLVTFKNTRTEGQRDKIKGWFRTTLLPTIADTDGTCFRVKGTRYHPDDLYGWLIKESALFKAQVIPAENPETGESNYPEKFSKEWLLMWRKELTPIIFDSQYNQDPSGMTGDIFQEHRIRWIKREDIPEPLYTFMGVDLAIGQKDIHDKFAIVVIGICPQYSRHVYVLDFFTDRLSLNRQNAEIYRLSERYKPLYVGIESNHFQAAKIQTLKNHRLYKKIPAMPLQTKEDKITRAQRLSVRFEHGEMYFLDHLKESELVYQLTSFPDGRYKDLFDALDFAIRIVASRRRKKKKRKKEPGIIGLRHF